MTGRQTPLYPRPSKATPGKFLDPESIAGWHRVYYVPQQVERSLSPQAFKVGLRLAVLEQRYAFLGKPPVPRFYTGKIVKIWGTDNGICTIEYDDHPHAQNISFGIKENALFCIAIPNKQKIRKGKARALAPAREEGA